MTTIQIITKNNESTLSKTLDSINNIKSKKIILDLGSTDKTIEICSGYDGLKLFNLDEEKSYAEIRNEFAEKDQANVYLNPWDTLIKGEDFLNDIIENQEKWNDPFFVYVLENKIISKEIRIWKNQKFENPVYESINAAGELEPRIIIYSNSNQAEDRRQENLNKTNKWIKEKPLSLEPYYYAACCHLSLRNYEKFIYYSDKYFLKETKVGDSYIILKYYNAQVKLHLKKIKSAVECVLFCLSYKPCMSEFWCLLGDIYYNQKKINKAISFYENALIIGQKRKNSDFLPIELVSYKEYPEQMIKALNKIKNEAKPI